MAYFPSRERTSDTFMKREGHLLRKSGHIKIGLSIGCKLAFSSYNVVR